MRKFSNRRGASPYLNATQLVRAHLGLTQQDLATLMRVSRGAVAMDERNERHLPWPNYQLLLHLSQVLPVPDGPAPVPPVAELGLPTGVPSTYGGRGWDWQPTHCEKSWRVAGCALPRRGCGSRRCPGYAPCSRPTMPGPSAG